MADRWLPMQRKEMTLGIVQLLEKSRFVAQVVVSKQLIQDIERLKTLMKIVEMKRERVTDVEVSES